MINAETIPGNSISLLRDPHIVEAGKFMKRFGDLVAVIKSLSR